MKTKIPFIIGLGQKAAQYRSLSKYLKIIQPDWNNGNFSKLKLGNPSIIIGFSLGCMIATMHAERHRIKTLILCSPTPDETLKRIKADHVIFLVGAKEKWVLKEIKRVKKTLNSTYTIKTVPNAGHKMNVRYQKILLDMISKNLQNKQGQINYFKK
jgi:esterase/lipase